MGRLLAACERVRSGKQVRLLLDPHPNTTMSQALLVSGHDDAVDHARRGTELVSAVVGSYDPTMINPKVPIDGSVPLRVLTAWVEAMVRVILETLRANVNLVTAVPGGQFSAGFIRILKEEDTNELDASLERFLPLFQGVGTKKPQQAGTAVLLFPFIGKDVNLTGSVHSAYEQGRYPGRTELPTRFLAADYQLVHLLLWASVSEECKGALTALFAGNLRGEGTQNSPGVSSHQWTDNVFYLIHGSVAASLAVWTALFFAKPGAKTVKPINTLLKMDEQVVALFLLCDAAKKVADFFKRVGRDPTPPGGSGALRLEDNEEPLAPGTDARAGAGARDRPKPSFLTLLTTRHLMHVEHALRGMNARREALLRTVKTHCTDIKLELRNVKVTAGKIGLNWLQEHTEKNREPAGGQGRGGNFDPRFLEGDGTRTLDGSPLKCLNETDPAGLLDRLGTDNDGPLQESPLDLEGIEHYVGGSKRTSGRGYVPKGQGRAQRGAAAGPRPPDEASEDGAAPPPPDGGGPGGRDAGHQPEEGGGGDDAAAPDPPAPSPAGGGGVVSRGGAAQERDRSVGARGEEEGQPPGGAAGGGAPVASGPAGGRLAPGGGGESGREGVAAGGALPARRGDLGSSPEGDARGVAPDEGSADDGSVDASFRSFPQVKPRGASRKRKRKDAVPPKKPPDSEVQVKVTKKADALLVKLVLALGHAGVLHDASDGEEGGDRVEAVRQSFLAIPDPLKSLVGRGKNHVVVGTPPGVRERVASPPPHVHLRSGEGTIFPAGVVRAAEDATCFAGVAIQVLAHCHGFLNAAAAAVKVLGLPEETPNALWRLARRLRDLNEERSRRVDEGMADDDVPLVQQGPAAVLRVGDNDWSQLGITNRQRQDDPCVLWGRYGLAEPLAGWFTTTFRFADTGEIHPTRSIVVQVLREDLREDVAGEGG